MNDMTDIAIRDVSDFRVLIVPGLHGSGELHWQTRWERLYPAFQRVEQLQWDVPDLVVWSEQLGATLQSSSRPTLIVAHSFGCLATVSLRDFAAESVVGALLVAPADPDKFDVAAALRGARLPYPSVVVGSTNDPWMAVDRAASWAALWGSEFVNAGPVGHINAESDLGDWQFGLSQLRRIIYAHEVSLQTDGLGQHA